MKSSFRGLASVGASLGLFTISLSFSLPVKAAVPCKDATIDFHQNGSLQSCTINNNVHVSRGSFAFTCKQGYSIFFDENAQFESCVISSPVQIRTGSTVETCPELSRVNFSIINYGDRSVSCHQL